MRSVLIDASNLRTGGGVQVAASFIDELVDFADDAEMVQRFPWLASVEVECSQLVSESLRTPATTIPFVHVVDHHPRDWRRWLPVREQHAVSFVVFGPEYFARRAARRIVGYADVRSVYPGPDGEVLSARAAWRWKVRGILSRALMRRPDVIVVESEAFGAQVVSRAIAPRERIVVVDNTYNAVFDRPETWARPATMPGEVDADHVLAYVTRAYPHKNLPFLPDVRRAAAELGVSIRFLVTLSDEQWTAQSAELREACVNLGPLPVTMVPAVYERADAAIFPSLLEAFSAMPLEAMRMGRVVFASDRDFLRTTCGDAAVYIDPLDPAAAAAVITATLADPPRVADHVARGQALVKALPSARDRALAYLQVIDAQVALSGQVQREAA